MIKVTFTFDDDTVAYLDRTATRLGMAKSRVVREAIRVYGEHMERLTEEERDRLLHVFDDVTATIPDRPRSEVDEELEDARNARRGGGRRAGGSRSRR